MVIRGLKEFEDMGMKGSTMVEPWREATCFEKRWVSENIGFKSVVLVG